MWVWISVGAFLIVGEILLRAIPVYERWLNRETPPDWSQFASYYDLSGAMAELRECGHVGPEEIMKNAMPRLLDFCFSKEDTGPVRARTMEFFREWGNRLEEGEPGMKQHARAMVETRLKIEPDQNWLLDVFDGKLSHHGAPRL